MRNWREVSTTAVNQVKNSFYSNYLKQKDTFSITPGNDRAYLLEAGSIRASGSAAELMASESIREAYLGV